MKKHTKIDIGFKNRQAWGLAIILGLSSSTAFSRTLIFQSDSDKNPVTQTTQRAVPINNVTNVAVQENSTSTVTNSSANSELFFMIEQLQQEVNSLRGLIEEQGYELRLLKQSGKDRYLDIDTRLLDLTKRINSGAGSAIFETPKPSLVTQNTAQSKLVTQAQPERQTTTSKVVAAPSTTDREPTKAETDDYQKAYSYIKNKQYDESILALFSYTEKYPDSPLTANVYYWLGEVYLATSKYEQAKTSFSLVISAYPDSQKVSDSLYKLAVTSDKLGDKSQAQYYIDQVQSKYPSSSAASLAKNYKITE